MENRGRGRSFQRGLSASLVVLLLIVTGAMAPEDEQPSGKLYVVEMYDFYFDPPGLYLQSGDRVIWVMLEDHLNDGHSATAYHPSNDKELRLPEEAEPWNSGLLRPIGDIYERTFTEIGVHDYFCIPHEDSGMVGRMIVKEATGPGTKPLEHGVSPAGQSIMPTLEEMLGPVGQIFNLQARINAVVLKVRQRERSEAVEIVNQLVQEFGAGAGQDQSLYVKLMELGVEDRLLSGLIELRTRIASGAPFSEIRKQAEALKMLLEEAAHQLSPKK